MIKVKSVFVKDDNPKPNPLSKLLKALFIVILILFSMDFGFVKHKSFHQKLTIKLSSQSSICLFGVNFFIMPLYLQTSVKNIIWYSRYLLEIYSFVLILLFTPEPKTFCTFLEHLHSIDSKLGINSSSYRLDIKIIMYCAATAMYKIITALIYCAHFNECVHPLWLQIIYFIPYSSMDVPLIILFFIYRSAHWRLVALRKFVESTKCEALHFQQLYKSLIDSTETVKKAFDPIFIVSLLADVPCLMGVIYEIIKEITFGSKNLTGYATESFVVFSTILVIFAPAVAASSLLTEVQKIKIYLYNMLLEEKDPQKERDIQKLISYVEARPFKFNVLGIIPMDTTLPMIVINLYITYLIVLLQLTHLY